MSDSWLDYPLGVFRAAARTAIGGLILSIFACMAGEWLYIVIVANLDSLGSESHCYYFPDLYDMIGVFLGTLAIGALSLCGIPLILLQLGCVCRILLEENLLRYWFIIAYSQALLTYIFSAITSDSYNFWGKNFASITVTLLILGIIHGLLAWCIQRQNR